LSEVLLWNQLKAKKLGFQFFRQKPIGNYIVDFYCPELKLVIEIDGSSHDSKFDYDRYRDEYLKTSGLNIMRFADDDIRHNIDSVLNSVHEFSARLRQPIPPVTKGVPRPNEERRGICDGVCWAMKRGISSVRINRDEPIADA